MGIIINEELEIYRKYIKNNLSTKRYYHSINVSLTAAALAMRYNYDILNAQIAGILHDCAKGINHKDLIQLCQKAKLNISEYERDNPELLHSKYGAYIATTKFNITNDDIVNAIKYHTVGRANMSLLEKIVFVSDYIEPSRSILPGINEIRQQAFIDIDIAIAQIYRNTIDFLSSKKTSIDGETIKAYEYYEGLLKGSK